MTAVLVILFAGIIAAGIGDVAPARLATIFNWGNIAPAVPVMFLALVRFFVSAI